MACETVRLPGGVAVIVCGPRRRRPQCNVHGCTRPGDYQCDAPRDGHSRKTCDAYLCVEHRVPQGNDVDYCLKHGGAGGAVQLKLELV